MSEVIVPGVLDIGVGDRRPHTAGHRQGMTRHHRRQGRQGELPVDWRIEPAACREAGKLLLDHLLLGWLDGQVGQHAGVGRDGGIDVEAVDRRLGVGLERLDGHRPVGLHDCGRKVDVAGVGFGAGEAHPVGGAGVVRRREWRWRGGRRRRRGGRRLGQRRRAAGQEEPYGQHDAGRSHVHCFHPVCAFCEIIRALPAEGRGGGQAVGFASRPSRKAA